MQGRGGFRGEAETRALLTGNICRWLLPPMKAPVTQPELSSGCTLFFPERATIFCSELTHRPHGICLFILHGSFAKKQPMERKCRPFPAPSRGSWWKHLLLPPSCPHALCTRMQLLLPWEVNPVSPAQEPRWDRARLWPTDARGGREHRAVGPAVQSRPRGGRETTRGQQSCLPTRGLPTAL